MNRQREFGLHLMRVALHNEEAAFNALLDKIEALTKERDFLAARLDAAEHELKTRVIPFGRTLGR